MAEFIAMHGYAIYIWPAYGFAGAALAGLALHTVWRARAVKR